MKKTCPCCGYRTLDKNMLFHVCEICYWEDDPIQSLDPDYVGGANGDITLRDAQQNFQTCGACHPKYADDVRKPNESDEKDEDFVSL